MARGLSSVRRWVGLVDAMFARHPDESRWMEHVRDAAKDLFAGQIDVDAVVFEYSRDSRVKHVRVATKPATRAHLESMIASGLEACGAGVQFVVAPDGSDSPVRARINCVAHPVPTVVTALSFALSETTGFGRQARALANRALLHLDAAHRLRLHPESVRAVVSSRGEILHRKRGAVLTPDIADRVRAIHHARSHRSEGIDLWPAMLNGEVTFVPVRRGSYTDYHVVDNQPVMRDLRSLTQLEESVVRHACAGEPNKMIAYALGVSPSTVSVALASASEKLGFASRVELVRIGALLIGDERADMSDAVLTTAEREIHDLLKQGLSNKAIAAARNRSVRTIANQIAAVLRKTGSRSRRELSVRVR